MDKEGEKALTESIITLIKLVKQLRSDRYLEMIENRRKLLFDNFLLGIVRGIGFALGATFVFAFIVWILSQLITIPLLGDWISSIINYIQEKRIY